MDNSSRFRGGSTIWTDQTSASIIANNEFFGVETMNKFWIKVSGVWKECVTWIKVLGVWKEATPKTKVTGIWK